MKLRLVILAALIAAIYPAIGLWARTRPAAAHPPAHDSSSGGPVVGDKPAANRLAASAAAPRLVAADPAVTHAPLAASLRSPAPMAMPAGTEAPATAPFFEPAGCQTPPEDYSRQRVNGWWLNRRTVAMLQHAAQLYAGPLDITGAAITQGSYSGEGLASFSGGTHLGGGAVDLSVTPAHKFQPLYDEVEPLIRALRVAGFAAWLRDRSELFVGDDIHIHAVAIGDAQLSPQAAEQLTGPFGYFRGYAGVPDAADAPVPDPHGGPVLCQWMRDAGYADLSVAVQQAARPANWQEKLKQAAQAYLANSVAETYQVAHRLDWLPGKTDDPSTMCGPLAAAILRDAGLLPAGIGPVHDIKSFWLAEPRENGRPWSFFSPRDYELSRFDTPISSFDFAAWPLRPADLVFTYQRLDGYEHLFVVTEVDGLGRAYTVTNYRLPSGSFMVQRVLLYDPNDPTVGVLKTDWVNNGQLGRTGMAGFDVMRQKGITLPPGSRYEYVVEPGDTLAAIVPKFNTTIDTVVADNQLANPYALGVGQRLTLTIGFPAQSSALDPAPVPTVPDVPYDVSALAKVVVLGAATARLRWQPNGDIIGALPDGTPVQVLYGRVEVDRVTWVQVRLENGVTGWVADFLLAVTGARPNT